MTTAYAVKSWNPETRVSRAAWFEVKHACPDRQPTELHWEKDSDGNDLRPRKWLICDRCGYAVDLVIRAPGIEEIA